MSLPFLRVRNFFVYFMICKTSKNPIAKVCLKNFLYSFFNPSNVHILVWEQERSISARRVRMSHLGSARKNVRSRALCAWILSRDGTFLCAEARWYVLTRRGKIGRSYAPSGDRTFLLPPDDISTLRTKKSTTQTVTKTSSTRSARTKTSTTRGAPTKKKHNSRDPGEEKHNSTALLLDLFKYYNK